MTYPPQQPLQYDPRYANAPAYQQPAPPQYGGAPAPQQSAPPMGGQALPTSAPALGQSGRTGGATAPAPRHLVGRTVIFEPIRIDETTTAKDNAGNMVSRPTAHYNLTVVDGGPLQYGDNRDHDVSKQHGMTFEVDTPCRFVGVSSDRFGIVNEVRDAIARGDLASVGVIVQGTQGNRPFLVTKPGRDLDGKDRPDGDQRFAAATELWSRIFAKDLAWNPTPRSLVAPPSQQPAQVSYQPQPAQGPTYGTAGGPAQYAYPTPAQYATYQPAGAQAQSPSYGTAGGPVPQQYPQPTYNQQQPAQPPANPAYEAWLASLPPEQRAAMLGGRPQQNGPGI